MNANLCIWWPYNPPQFGNVVLNLTVRLRLCALFIFVCILFRPHSLNVLMSAQLKCQNWWAIWAFTWATFVPFGVCRVRVSDFRWDRSSQSKNKWELSNTTIQGIQRVDIVVGWQQNILNTEFFVVHFALNQCGK